MSARLSQTSQGTQGSSGSSSQSRGRSSASGSSGEDSSDGSSRVWGIGALAGVLVLIATITICCVCRETKKTCAQWGKDFTKKDPKIKNSGCGEDSKFNSKMKKNDEMVPESKFSEKCCVKKDAEQGEGGNTKPGQDDNTKPGQDDNTTTTTKKCADWDKVKGKGKPTCGPSKGFKPLNKATPVLKKHFVEQCCADKKQCGDWKKANEQCDEGHGYEKSTTKPVFQNDYAKKCCAVKKSCAFWHAPMGGANLQCKGENKQFNQKSENDEVLKSQFTKKCCMTVKPIDNKPKKTCADWQNDDNETCAADSDKPVFKPENATAKLLQSEFVDKCCAAKTADEETPDEEEDTKEGCLQNKWVKRSGLAAVIALVAYGGYKGYQNAAAIGAGLGQGWTWVSGKLGSAWTAVSGGVTGVLGWVWVQIQKLKCW